MSGAWIKKVVGVPPDLFWFFSKEYETKINWFQIPIGWERLIEFTWISTFSVLSRDYFNVLDGWQTFDTERLPVANFSNSTSACDYCSSQIRYCPGFELLTPPLRIPGSYFHSMLVQHTCDMLVLATPFHQSGLAVGHVTASHQHVSLKHDLRVQSCKFVFSAFSVSFMPKSSNPEV